MRANEQEENRIAERVGSRSPAGLLIHTVEKLRGRTLDKLVNTKEIETLIVIVVERLDEDTDEETRIQRAGCATITSSDLRDELYELDDNRDEEN